MAPRQTNPQPPRTQAPPPAQSQPSRTPVPQQAARRPPPVQAPPPPMGSQAFNSLFIPAPEVKTLLKVVLYGSYGTGKTPVALSFPRPAVIDVEGLAKVYARSFPEARFMPATNFQSVKAGIEAVIADGGKSCDTLVIDSLTPIYDQLKFYYLEKFGYLDQPQWTRINTMMKSIYNLLAACPVHTVVIGREAVQYEEIPNRDPGKRAELKAVGVRMDLDKAAGYQPNILIHITGNRAGIVEKVQGVEMAQGTKIDLCTWGEFFEPIAQSLASGDDPDDITKGVGKALFLAYWNGRGIQNSRIAQALGVKSAEQWTKGRPAADAQILDFGTRNGWFAPEPEPETEQPAQPPAPQSPLSGNPDGAPERVPENGFEDALNDALVPMSYRTFPRMISTYETLVNSNQIPPDWDTNQIIDYLTDYAVMNSE